MSACGLLLYKGSTEATRHLPSPYSSHQSHWNMRTEGKEISLGLSCINFKSFIRQDSIKRQKKWRLSTQMFSFLFLHSYRRQILLLSRDWKRQFINPYCTHFNQSVHSSKDDCFRQLLCSLPADFVTQHRTEKISFRCPFITFNLRRRWSFLRLRRMNQEIPVEQTTAQLRNKNKSVWWVWG